MVYFITKTRPQIVSRSKSYDIIFTVFKQFFRFLWVFTVFFCWNKKFSIAKWKVGLKQNLLFNSVGFSFFILFTLKRFSLIFHFFSGRVVCTERVHAHATNTSAAILVRHDARCRTQCTPLGCTQHGFCFYSRLFFLSFFVKTFFFYFLNSRF